MSDLHTISRHLASENKEVVELGLLALANLRDYTGQYPSLSDQFFTPLEKYVLTHNPELGSNPGFNATFIAVAHEALASYGTKTFQLLIDAVGNPNRKQAENALDMLSGWALDIYPNKGLSQGQIFAVAVRLRELSQAGDPDNFYSSRLQLWEEIFSSRG